MNWRAALAAAAATVALTACGQSSGPAPRALDPEEAGLSRNEAPSTIGDLVQSNRVDGPQGQNLAVNKHLWRASLDTLSFLPLESTDPFSGVIATDWAASGGSTDERFKVTVYISEPTLEARSLRVAVFRETLSGNGAWVPAQVSEATPRRLEDAILTRARQMRVEELAAASG